MTSFRDISAAIRLAFVSSFSHEAERRLNASLDQLDDVLDERRATSLADHVRKIGRVL